MHSLYSRDFDGWNSFTYGAFHSEGLEMFAGQVIQLKTSVFFDENELIPSDYSVVVWAEKQKVKMTSEGSDVSAPFPIFELDESI